MPEETWDAAEVARRLGGSARWHELLRYSTSWSVRRALAEGRLVRTARGAYALPGSPPALRTAAAVRGLVSHRSAAAHWRLEGVAPHPEVDVTVRRHSGVRPRPGVRLHHSDVDPGDDHGGVTSPLRTVVDCAAALPFPEALAVAGIKHVDLGEERTRLALEADSFQFHGTPAALERDCRRYDELVAAGWAVLRFSWDHVAFERAWVLNTVRRTRRLRLARARAGQSA